MAKARTLVGLDVHAAKVVAAILDAETGELRFQRLGGNSEPVVRLCSSLEGPVRASYEAGPTGYGLARALDLAGVECVVAAPGKIPRGATERVKTDRRDAEHLVRLLLAGKLHPVRVPGRRPRRRFATWFAPARTSGQDLMRARHRLSKLLLRHEVRFEGRAWADAPPRLAGQGSSCRGAPRRRPLSTTWARSRRWSIARVSSSARSAPRSPTRPGHWRSAGFAACAASTP